MRLAANFHAVEAASDGAQVLAVIKADAYGHGAELCAPVLARAGARWLGVTDAAEGARVRAALQREGFGVPDEPDILVMCGSLPEEAAAIAEFRLTPVVWTVEQVRALQGLLQPKVHIEIDTGMGRQGARPGEQLESLLSAVRDCRIKVCGVFTHLCNSEEAQSTVTVLQKQKFESAVARVVTLGLHPNMLHIANSSALDNPVGIKEWIVQLAQKTEARLMARTGIALYGHVLPISQADCGPCDDVPSPQLAPKLAPVLTWKARVLAIRDLRAGETVGYGATFRAPSAMRIALLPVGYADGLRRELSNPGTKPCAPSQAGWVVAVDRNGLRHRCSILGRVSMNLAVVDVSAAAWVDVGDAVTLLGEGVTAEDHARIAGTISYEILCGLRSNPHFLINGNG